MGSLTEIRDVLKLPPLSLYLHLPWCVKKCPYCDFNSHAVQGEIPTGEYIKALLADLENDLSLVWGRPVHSVFFGGGTPSLFSAAQIDQILQGVRSRLRLVPAAEITLEANPGTIEHDSFSAYRDAGINRVSLGVQSFDDDALSRIGRIHGRREIEQAIQSIHNAGVENFNIDLMFGLPNQTLQAALSDVKEALACKASHLSHYQLTLEPNTAFQAQPPVLPAQEACWEMQETCSTLLTAQGFEQYEISAWARPARQCMHNLNYWRYGDYLGIGAGAHGKITLPAMGEIRRLSKQRDPKAYLRALKSGHWRVEDRAVSDQERCFEFFLNQLRLHHGVKIQDFGPRTGLSWSFTSEAVSRAQDRGLLEQKDEMLVPTELGRRFVNETQMLFLPP
jgi:oxygen-independent coproporphyrinogen-3 oxidase